MGRVKIPRCDNCGAPVEFAHGSLEARCEYCSEVLIREFPAAPAPAPVPYVPPGPLPPPPAAAPRARVAPFMIAGLATLAIAGASVIASLASHIKPLPTPAPVVRETLAVAAPLRVEAESAAQRPSPARAELSERARTAEAATTRGRLRARPTASAAPTSARAPAAPAIVEPPKAARFDSAQAVAGLDAAKAKAEASCKGSSGVRLFIQMGFDADGVNRGAALSDPKLKGTPEAKCALRIFRAVRIPAFDMATRPSGLGRAVRL